MSGTTDGQKMTRAVQLGREIEKICGNLALQRLSKEAWLIGCADLAGTDQGGLAELRSRIERECPRLWGEVATRGRLWADRGQDRPAPFHGFGPDGDQGAYAERLAAQITVDQASAVAALVTAELRPATWWGRLNDFSEVQAMLEPLRGELQRLDLELAATTRFCDATWRGSKAYLIAGGVELEIRLGEGCSSTLASDLAEAARLRSISSIAA